MFTMIGNITMGQIWTALNTVLFQNCTFYTLFMFILLIFLVFWWKGIHWIGRYRQNFFVMNQGYMAYVYMTIIGFILVILWVPVLAAYLVMVGPYLHACPALWAS